ncbi:MAG TPA: hypothetical protein DEP82_14915 [Arthrobacter bacterium]|nr:hypothetical protein [Arthrobacter sp.]
MPSATHVHASGLYADTETTVTWNDGSTVVWVRVRCLPFLVYWVRPDAKLIRKWVDALLAGSGMRRDGARFEHGFVSDGWSYTYYLKRTT